MSHDEHRPRNKAAGFGTRSRRNRRGTAWPCASVRAAAQQRRSAAFRQQRRRWESAANRENRSSRLGRTTNNDSNGESNGGRTRTGSVTTRAAALHGTAGRAGSSGNRTHEGRHARDRHQTGGRYVLERQLARQRRQTAWPDAAAQAAARRYCAAARTQTRSSTQRAGARALWSGGSRAD